MGNVAVGEMDIIHCVLGDEGVEVRLGVDRDTLGVELARELGRVFAALDVRDLGGGEGDNLVGRVVAEIYVEVVEVPSGGAHDDDFLHNNCSLSDRAACSMG